MRQLQAETIDASRTVTGVQVHELRYRRGLIISLVAACLMTLVGAFDSDVLPFVPRLSYWLIIMMTGSVIGIGASTGVRHWGRFATRPLIEGALITGLIAAPLTAVTMGTTLAFFGGTAPALPRIAVLFGLVLAITAAIVATIYAVARSGLPPRTAQGAEPGEAQAQGRPASVPVTPAETPEAPAVLTSGSIDTIEGLAIDVAGEPAAAPARARLLDRLPMRLRGAELYAIEAEDHYLRVHTSAGSDLILLRMADALSELGDVAGARTHRSWWVARSAVDSVRRGNGRAELTLKGEIVAPVSRSYFPLLLQEGWFS